MLAGAGAAGAAAEAAGAAAGAAVAAAEAPTGQLACLHTKFLPLNRVRANAHLLPQSSEAVTGTEGAAGAGAAAAAGAGAGAAAAAGAGAEASDMMSREAMATANSVIFISD